MLEESQKKYMKNHLEIQRIREKIELRKEQIERLKKKEDKIWNENSWTEILLRPIIKLIVDKYPEVSWGDTYRLAPMGLRSAVSFFGKIDDRTIWICFTPSNLKNGEISFDTGEVEGNYPVNSIGNLNGFHRKTKVLESIDQIFELIEKQIKEEK